MKKKLNGTKGITLIALVITIIVLLILAGISIVTLTGENGLLTNSSKAKVEKIHADVLEMMKLEAQSYYIEKKTNGVNNTLIEYLQEKGILSAESEDGSCQIDVKALLGSRQAIGGGTEGQDVYVLEKVEGSYKIKYYDVEKIERVLGDITDIEVADEDLGKEFEYLFIVDDDGVLTYNSTYAYYGAESWGNGRYCLS